MPKPIEVQYRASNNSGSDYYSCPHEEGKPPVTVVHTKHGTFVCMTCKENNRMDCAHTRAVAEFVSAGGGPTRPSVPQSLSIDPELL